MNWHPASGCDDGCRPGGHTRVRPVTAGLRVAGLIGVLLTGLLPAALLRGAALQALPRAILAVLGVRLVWRGAVPRPGSLLVANHVSWLDIVALYSVVPVRLVAKHDVREWPAIGATADRSGAIFIDRTRPKTLPRTVGEVAAALRGGRSVALFPEGTTYCGTESGPFRPALFQAAIDAEAPVVPISISYDSTEAAFVGEDTLWESVLRVARVRRLTVTLAAAPALRPEPGAGRQTLARAAQSSLGGSGYRLAA
ncbi:1-acyl-sn-glycerol-3-phosphate acyltransferase [Actinoplanes lutulentus]|uniref:1-acyl-sn-glycerol-3-phosphate acyltransferase n=1 Tax=Actinoplanes lutulentus TaxID=1287878 RepID=A0A327Z6S3_9ACTN|nr:lysophospholipid acyltransferase family protein [Actinoplanes lutulentus]MBB2946208.1 1-acyl-sn-glycerol-3-phosphate acyltransferase [Actinoplanes lutulentus]RAK32897.1 1-acyl-sn-glycerol-3-phosphate acyltransferase [Actinoplanes lutulentus]